MSSFFQMTLVFWLLAFGAATHDISSDGFYMLALEQHQQARLSVYAVCFSGCRC
jgi:PAT family beta-lactamase induction signal transducer AmpG